MTTAKPSLKHERVAALLAEQIKSGRMGPGEQLPGEISLAERFKVSRTTVRNALAELNSAGLIATRVGKGSYVLFDGRPLHAKEGWARAFADQGIAETARVLDIRALTDPGLAKRLDRRTDTFVLVTRVREIRDGGAISLERSWLPPIGDLAQLPSRSVETLSLTEALAAEGLIPETGTQRMGARPLTPEESEVLGREPGTFFLFMERTTLSSTGDLVEHIECVLDPEHFTFELTVSGPPD